MKPSKIHYLLANGFKLSTWGTSAILTGSLGWVYFFRSGVSVRELVSLWSLLLMLLSLPLGWFLGGAVIWPLVGSIASKINGAPFAAGDEVCILVGQYRDRVVRVYEVWKDRHQLRVDLDEQRKNEVKDVFSFHEVCRHRM